jgi:alcohol dehydrogenase
MKALVYHGQGKKQLEDMPKPVLREATDAIVRMTGAAVCGMPCTANKMVGCSLIR